MESDPDKLRPRAGTLLDEYIARARADQKAGKMTSERQKAANRATLFRRRGCEKVAPAGQFEVAGRVAVRCLDDGSAEHSLPKPAERQLRLRGSNCPERLFP